MMNTKKLLVIAFALPIISLIALTVNHWRQATYGKRHILPVKGYDPRDLLSGHYIAYQVDYGIDGLCIAAPDILRGSSAPKKVFTSRYHTGEGYICLEPRDFTYSRPEHCNSYISGTCLNGRFIAGIERFYIPEEKAEELDARVRENKSSIEISVLSTGKARVINFLIEGKPWDSK